MPYWAGALWWIFIFEWSESNICWFNNFSSIFHSAKVYNLNQKLNFVQIWYRWKIICWNTIRCSPIARWTIFCCIIPPFWVWIECRVVEGEGGGVLKWRGGSFPSHALTQHSITFVEQVNQSQIKYEYGIPLFILPLFVFTILYL